jgi:hypothetical protein
MKRYLFLLVLSSLALSAQTGSFPPAGASGGTGTVTSVGLTMPSTFCSTGSAVTDSGSLTCTYATGQTANRVFATDASGNVGSFALTGAMLPNPSATTLGGVQSIASVTHNFLTSISTSGVPAKAQPAIADLSDGTSLATLNALVNTQTGTTYTLVAADNGKIVTLNNASAITLTVPASLGAGFNCLIVQLGAGQVTPTASSTTLHNRQSFTKTAGQYAVATLAAYVADTFVLGGDLQ